MKSSNGLGFILDDWLGKVHKTFGAIVGRFDIVRYAS